MATARAPLIEREPALAAAEQAIADARGDGSVVFFAGSAGADKTHLLDAIHSAAQGTVLRACGHVSETTLAYGLVRQLFDDLLDELSPPERERLFGGPAGAALPLLGRGGPPAGASSTPTSPRVTGCGSCYRRSPVGGPCVEGRVHGWWYACGEAGR